MTAPPKRILCTNDDGIHSPGLALLAEVAGASGEVTVVAPDRQQSATSHALTLHRPLRITRVEDGRHAIDGTPTDCVLLAFKEVLEDPPDFVLSGVNHGPNMGEDVLYSGTVAAAMEATILGVPAAAFSFVGSVDDVTPYASLLAGLLDGILGRPGFPRETFLNINIPDLPPDEIKGVEVTSLGRRVYYDSLTRSVDPRGADYYWIGGGRSDWRGRDDSDFRAIHAGYVSVTPMHLDLTNFDLLHEVKSWSLGDDGGARP